MKISKCAQLAFNMLVHSKLRSWLTIIGIVIGVAAVVIIVSTGAGAQATLQAQLTSFGTDVVAINPTGQMGFGSAVAGQLTDKDLQAVEGIPGVKAITPQIVKPAKVTYAGETKLLQIAAMKPSVFSEMMKDSMDFGRIMTDSETKNILVGKNVAEEAFDRQILLNQVVEIGGQNFRVVGITEFGGMMSMMNGFLFMHIDPAEDLLFLEGEEITYSEIDLLVYDSSEIDKVAETARERLYLSRHETEKDKTFQVTTPKDILETVNSITSMITMFLGAIAVISLVVGAVGIMNTMFTSVLEKTKEIGILKSIGARNGDIIMIFLLNAGMVGLVGGALGCSIGIGIVYAITYAINVYGIAFEIAISPLFISEALLLATFVGMLAGTIPAWRASKLNPVDALRYE